MTDFGLEISQGAFSKIVVQPIVDGRKVSVYSSQIPSQFRRLFRHSMSYSFSEDDIIQVFRDSTDIPTIYFKDMDRHQGYSWLSQDLRRRIVVNFDTQSKNVTIRKCLYVDGRYVSRFKEYGEKFVALPIQSQLGFVAECDSWELWDFLNESFSSGKTADSEMTLSLGQFNGFMVENRIHASHFSDSVDFTVNDQPSSPDRIEPTYFGAFTRRDDQFEFSLKAHLATNEVFIYSPLAGYLLTMSKLPDDIPPSSFDRFLRPLVKDACKKELPFSTVLDDFPKENKKYLKSMVAIEKMLGQMDDAMSLSQSILVNDDRWVMVSWDNQLESKVLLNFYDCFQTDLQTHLYQHHTVSLSGSNFFNGFSPFFKLLEELGISLEIDQQPSKLVSLNSKVAVKSVSNWFEVHPEIGASSANLSKVELDELLSGMVMSEDSAIVLDQQSIQQATSLLQLIASFGDLSKETNKKELEQPRKVTRLEILDWLVLERYGVQFEFPPAIAHIIMSLKNFDTIPEYPIPKQFNGELRDYQIKAYRWLLFLYHHRFGACLADEMGLGKTIQALVLLAGIHENVAAQKDVIINPHVIIVPPSLLYNWRREIERFCPLMSVTTLRKIDQLDDALQSNVILMTYDFVRVHGQHLMEYDFGVGVFDEAQYVKNQDAARSKAAKALKTRFNVCLTGTPMENNIREFFSVISLAVPGLLSKTRTETIEQLSLKTKPFLLRRTKKELLPELPDKIESEVSLNLNDQQKLMYSQIVKEVREQIDSIFLRHKGGKAKWMALTALLRLRQLCNSPSLLGIEENETSPKVEFVLEHANDILANGHSMLIFSQFTQYLDVIQNALAEKGLSFSRIDGSVSAFKRQKIVDEFQNDEEGRILLLSLKTGGVGLNLTRASYVFHMDPWWNPFVEQQATDRTHRIGQTKNVTIYRLMMHHTIEEKVMTLRQEKAKLFQQLLEDGVEGVEEPVITKEDIQNLLA